VISRVWQVADCCTNIATCTQTVTIGFPPGFTDPGGLLPGFESSFLPPSSDDISSNVPTCFSFCFCGTTHSNLWINNDGNVTLDGPFGGHGTGAPVKSFRPVMPLCSIAHAIFAPFWADIDTVPPGTGTVGWGCGCAFVPGIGARPAFGVTWRGVGYFKGHSGKTNSFQLLIIDRSADGAPGDFDLQYRYQGMQWEVAESGSESADGLCFVPTDPAARSGFAGGPACCFELPGSFRCGELIDGGAHALVSNHTPGNPDGVYTWHFTNCVAAATGGGP
jgi:hypothetical protein